MANSKLSDLTLITNAELDGTESLYIIDPNEPLSVDRSKRITVSELDSRYINETGDAAKIKTLYESNADTNAYTDAEQTKVGFLTITQAVDLDTLETDVGLNNTHRTSDGSDHSFIDQSVTTSASPSFAGLTVDTNVLFVDSINDRVSIGHILPDSKFHVRFDGDQSVGGVPGAKIENQGGTLNDFALMEFKTDSGSGYVFKNSSTNTNFAGAGSMSIGTISAEAFSILTSGASRLVIDPSGNVGFGVTDPDEQLELTGRIHLGQTTAPGTTTDKLYNVGGDLFWNGSAVSGVSETSGTWTPQSLAGATDITSVSQTDGTYKRIGNVVHLQAFIRVNRGTNTGSYSIAGLPFTASSTNLAVCLTRSDDRVMIHEHTGQISNNATVIDWLDKPTSTSDTISNSLVENLFPASTEAIYLLNVTYFV